MWFCTIDQWSPSPAGVHSVGDVLALHGQGRSYSCTSIKNFDENALSVIICIQSRCLGKAEDFISDFLGAPFLGYIQALSTEEQEPHTPAYSVPISLSP